MGGWFNRNPPRHMSLSLIHSDVNWGLIIFRVKWKHNASFIPRSSSGTKMRYIFGEYWAFDFPGKMFDLYHKLSYDYCMASVSLYPFNIETFLDRAQENKTEIIRDSRKGAIIITVGHIMTSIAVIHELSFFSRWKAQKIGLEPTYVLRVLIYI